MWSKAKGAMYDDAEDQKQLKQKQLILARYEPVT